MIAEARNGGAFFKPLALAGVVALLGGLYRALAGFGPGEQSAEAALLSEVKKLTASDAQAGDNFGVGLPPPWLRGEGLIAGTRRSPEPPGR